MRLQVACEDFRWLVKNCCLVKFQAVWKIIVNEYVVDKMEKRRMLISLYEKRIQIPVNSECGNQSYHPDSLIIHDSSCFKHHKTFSAVPHINFMRKVY